MKVSAILKGPKDNLGRQRIYVRINSGEKRTFRPTRLRIEPELFKNGLVVGSPRAKQYNSIIKEAILDAEYNIIKESPVFADSDYRIYMYRLLKRWDREKKPATLTQFETENLKFLAWLKKDIKISKVTQSILEDYKAYLNQKYNGSNTVAKGFKNIRTLFTSAHQIDKIIREDPFIGYKKPNYKNPRRDYLTQSQVDRIESYTKNHCPEGLKIYAYWFLIGCYTGLRYSDMRQFNKKQHLKGGRLTLYTIKTDDIVSIPFMDKAKEFFQAIDYKNMHHSNKTFNENLKIIQKACDIELNLTVHVSRHTFAVRCAEAGLSKDVTARLLGQTDTKSTSVYYKITDKLIDEEFKKVS